MVHQLRNGKLLDAHDEKMLFGPHDDDATATEKRELNAWYEKVKRDPRCCTAHRCATTRRSWLLPGCAGRDAPSHPPRSSALW